MRKATILLTTLTLCLTFGVLSASYNPSVFTDISALLENNSVDGEFSLPDKTGGYMMISNGADNDGGSYQTGINTETSVSDPNYLFDDNPSASQDSPVTPPAIPEPGTLFLVGLGLLGTGMLVRKK